MNVTTTSFAKTELDEPLPDPVAPDAPPLGDADAPAAEDYPAADTWTDDGSGDDEAAQPEEPKIAPHLVPPQPKPLRIAVVGSAAWRSRSAVLEAVQDYWHGAGAPDVTLIVSGCPIGAERTVVDAAAAMPRWEVAVARDEDLGRAQIDQAFAFIRDYSEGAERTLAFLRDARVPVEVLREESSEPGAPDPWASR